MMMPEGYQPYNLANKVAEKLSITKSLARKWITQNMMKSKQEDNIENQLPNSSEG